MTTISIKIKDYVPTHIAMVAVLAVANEAKTNENGELEYPKLTAVPVRGATINVKTRSNRKSLSFEVGIKKD